MFRACCHITLSSRETSPRTTRCTSLRVSLRSVPLHAQKGSAKGSSLQQTNPIEGYHRLFEFLWYFLLLFFSSQFITVLAISVLSSLCYLQPWHPWDLIVMVVIWCTSFSANKTANHSDFTFNRTDVVFLTEALMDIKKSCPSVIRSPCPLRSAMQSDRSDIYASMNS